MQKVEEKVNSGLSRPAITKVKEEDIEQLVLVIQCSRPVARRLLEAEPNLEKAVESYYEIKEASEDALSTSSSLLSPVEEDDSLFQFSLITRAPKWLARSLLKFSSNDVSQALSVFYGTDGDSTSEEGNSSSGGVGASVFGMNELGTLYTTPKDIKYSGTLPAACNEALHRGLFVLLNIQDDKEFQSHVLNRDVWADGAVKDLLRVSALFCQKDAFSADVAFYKSIYVKTKKEMVLPHIALLNPETGLRVKTWEGKERLQKEYFLSTLADYLAPRGS